MNRAYKFRLYPSKDQEVLLSKTFGSVRFIYNKMLGEKIYHYNETKESLKTNPSSYKDEFQWLREVDSLALTSAWTNLNTAYNNFFKKPSVGFPKFKSKRRDKDSYTTFNQSNSIRIVNSKIKLPKLGFVKCKVHRSIPEHYLIKSATITKTSTGKYFVSILFEFEFINPEPKLDKSKSIGLDYSSHSFYVDNQNIEADYPKFYRTTQTKLAREQRKKDKMVKGSKNRAKQRVKVARLHEKIKNQRLDFLHKLSTKLANLYDYVCIEDLNMKNISQCLKLAKSTLDNSFGLFRTLLSYKLDERGKKLLKIDKWFPSSKMCRFCGTVNTDLKLSDRIWTCSCGKELNRDENAAINILNEALSYV